MSMDPDGKDFLLHLYDKLWENMGAKEGRLWSYLSVYGAAVALALGVGQYAGAELYAVSIVLALTVWALLIVINANWWYQRNRLMVTQIEKKFVVSGAVDGVVPRSYRDARFDFDRLYRGSALVLAAIASMLYLKVMWEHRSPDAFATVELVVSIGLLYSLFLASIMYCVAQYQSYIHSFFLTKEKLLQEAGGLSDAEINKSVEDGRKEAYGSYSWFRPGLVLVLFGLLVFDLLPGSSDIRRDAGGIVGGVLQVLLAAAYVVVVKVQARKDGPVWRKTWLIQLVCILLISASSILLLRVPYETAKAAAQPTSSQTE